MIGPDAKNHFCVDVHVRITGIPPVAHAPRQTKEGKTLIYKGKNASFMQITWGKYSLACGKAI
jgi:hypothetical protein